MRADYRVRLIAVDIFDKLFVNELLRLTRNARAESPVVGDLIDLSVYLGDKLCLEQIALIDSFPERRENMLISVKRFAFVAH